MTLVRRCAIALAVLSGASCGGPASFETPARREARRLFLEGLDHQLRLDYGSAAEAIHQSFGVDPAYLPALSFLWNEFAQSSRVARLLDTLDESVTDPGVARCVRRVASVYRGISRTVPPAPNSESRDGRLCSFYVHDAQERPYGRPDVLDSLLAIARLFSESPILETEFGLADKGDREAIEAALRAPARKRGHPLKRVQLNSELVFALHEIGDDSAALEIERAVVRDPAWAYPGFRIAWASSMTNHSSLRVLNRGAPDPALLRHVDSMVLAVNTVRRSALSLGDLEARLSVVATMGVEALDRGRLEEAVQLLSSSVPMADSVGDQGWRSYVRMRFGRALVKAGRAPEAEKVLMEARSLGDSAGLVVLQKEVEHNLLHLYESLGRDDDALKAGEAFVRFTAVGFLDPVRMMSARDVGLFLRARGRVDESRRYFERMLADIDSLGGYRFYAGEYHEMTGALDDALKVYSSAAARAEEPVRVLAGLVRVALATGDTAGARRWALMHDARRDAPGRPEAFPLLPSVLRRTAGGDVARQAFLVARNEVARHGQVSAWATLTADLSDLESDLENFARAASLADSAGDAAKKVGALEIVMRARARAAFARVRMGGRRDGGASLHSIAAIATEADRTGGVLVRADVHRLLAGALASTGQWREALSEYRRAVIPLDSVAGRIAMDPGQATFRSAQRRAYDEALITIVRNARAPGATEAYASWSARRKGRAYAVQWPVNDDVSLARPAPGTALVDYVMLDTLIAAMVVTTNAATIVQLEAGPRQVRADAEELRRAVDVRVGSSLDVRRAHFSLPVAHRLYRALVQPLEAHLAGARTLVMVPDGILSLVPFDALVTAMPANPSDHAGATYVLDRHVVVNGTTIQTEPSAWRVPVTRVALIDPGTAPDAAREIDAIAATLPHRSITLLRGQHATRSGTIAVMRDADVVHFAAHSRANEHDPGSSQIDLSPDDNDDGRLGASDIAALRLNAPLVILSACETANGRVLDGEGVLSMSRSFLRAGARATVATLWPVGPSSSDFAEAFYANVVRSGNAAEAIHAAKLSLRSRGASPSAWGPYQLFAAPPSGRPQSGMVATTR